MTNTMKPLILAVALIAVTAANAPTADADIYDQIESGLYWNPLEPDYTIEIR